jgi:hypothetical protein
MQFFRKARMDNQFGSCFSLKKWVQSCRSKKHASATATDFVANPTLIRLDIDTSRLCTIMKI